MVIKRCAEGKRIIGDVGRLAVLLVKRQIAFLKRRAKMRRAFVDAEIEFLFFRLFEKDERILADIGRYISAFFPAMVGFDEIIRAFKANNGYWHRIFA